jgi:nucleoside-diphosphate-sugar epimerase
MTLANAIAQLRGGPVTILGAGGFVGSHLARYLQAHGVKFSAPQKDDKSYINHDLGYVFYCIGLTADYAKRPFDVITAHIDLLAQILRAGRYQRLVYLSSTRLYDSGAGGGVETQDLIFNPANPRHSYDLSKAMGEWLCLHTGQGRASVARLASVYSTTDLSDRNFLHTTIEEALGGQNFSLRTAADYARDYVHTDDVCAALACILANGRQGIYNVASGQNISNRELFLKIQTLTGVLINPEMPPTGITAPQIDINRIRDEFGLKPAKLLDKLAEYFNPHSQSAASGA